MVAGQARKSEMQQIYSYAIPPPIKTEWMMTIWDKIATREVPTQHPCLIPRTSATLHQQNIGIRVTHFYWTQT